MEAFLGWMRASTLQHTHMSRQWQWTAKETAHRKGQVGSQESASVTGSGYGSMCCVPPSKANAPLSTLKSLLKYHPALSLPEQMERERRNKTCVSWHSLECQTKDSWSLAGGIHTVPKA